MVQTPHHVDVCITHKTTGRGIQWEEERIELDRCRDATASMLSGHSEPDPCVFVAVRLRYVKPDPVAVVRRGVESGTIKGEVLEWCDYHKAQIREPSERMLCGVGWVHLRNGKPSEAAHCNVGTRRVIAIPVSDGGSET